MKHTLLTLYRLTIAVLIAALAFAAGCTQQPAATNTVSSLDLRPAENLAILDGRVGNTSEYQMLLTKVAMASGEREAKVADRTVKGVQAAGKGTCLQFLQALEATDDKGKSKR